MDGIPIQHLDYDVRYSRLFQSCDPLYFDLGVPIRSHVHWRYWFNSSLTEKSNLPVYTWIKNVLLLSCIIAKGKLSVHTRIKKLLNTYRNVLAQSPNGEGKKWAIVRVLKYNEPVNFFPAYYTGVLKFFWLVSEASLCAWDTNFLSIAIYSSIPGNHTIVFVWIKIIFKRFRLKSTQKWLKTNENETFKNGCTGEKQSHKTDGWIGTFFGKTFFKSRSIVSQ